MFGRLLGITLTCLSLAGFGCVAATEGPEEDQGEQASAVQIRTSTPNGCYIAICKKDGSGQYASMLRGTLSCDVHKNCYCERDGETAGCGWNSTDCRQKCTKTTPSKMEPRAPIGPGPIGVYSP